MEMEFMTEKLNILTNVVDVPTDPVRIKNGDNCPLIPLGYANDTSSKDLRHGCIQLCGVAANGFLFVVVWSYFILNGMLV